MPSGTSIRGMQRLYQNAASPTNGFFIEIDAGVFFPPSRAGFYYLIYHELNTGADGTVVAAGVCYRPGMSFYLPRRVGNAGDRTALWVDWNIAGLAWTAGAID
jgi:hypothetical protein